MIFFHAALIFSKSRTDFKMAPLLFEIDYFHNYVS
jgi:hypothetical protein